MRKLNDWYDNLPTRKREIFFVTFVGGTLLLSEIALWVFGFVWALPVWIFVMTGLRLSYLRQPKRFIADIEKNGLNKNSLKSISNHYKVETISQGKWTLLPKSTTSEHLNKLIDLANKQDKTKKDE